MSFLTRVDGLSQISARTCGRRQRWCGSFPGQIRQGKRSRNSRTKAQADQATCAFLLVGGEAARRCPATGRAVRSLGGLGWGMRLRRHWLGIVASFREDDLFEGETCQKSGGFYHLGKNSSEEGKVAPSPLPKKRTRNKSPGWFIRCPRVEHKGFKGGCYTASSR